MLICFYFRGLEDFITWVNSSAIKRHVMEYNDAVSYDLISNLNFFLAIDAPKIGYIHINFDMRKLYYFAVIEKCCSHQHFSPWESGDTDLEN